tara:strand:- start:196 stop:396 length:201 start_codon:yes stop_codon:yes gene_type:complete
MTKKENFISIIAFCIGVLMILLPLYFDTNKPLILIGIIPLWLGAYSLIYGKKQAQNDKNTKIDNFS